MSTMILDQAEQTLHAMQSGLIDTSLARHGLAQVSDTEVARRLAIVHQMRRLYTDLRAAKLRVDSR
jgi:hypothetical protein